MCACVSSKPATWGALALPGGPSEPDQQAESSEHDAAEH